MNKELRIMVKYAAQVFIFVVLTSFFLLHASLPALAGPQSTTYEIKEYTFGAGGTGATGVTSTNYSLFGTTGELEYNKLTSTTYGLGGGLIFTLKTNVPGQPTFTNPATNYDRLKIVLNTSGNPTDTTFAIAISTDNFGADTRFIKSDGTVGTTLAAADFKTYTNWGGASGFFVTGLINNTTYYIKVKARQGNFSESEYGQTASVATSYSSLTFGLDSSTLTFSNLNSGNSYTDSSKTTVLTTSTNAYGGYIVYAKETAALTYNVSSTISNFASSNSSPATWTGTGFGYTTNDSALSGGTADRFTNGGPKYAGFVTSGNGDPVADHTAPIQDPAVSNEQFTIAYRVTGSATTPAGIYTNTIIYTIVPTY